MGSENIFYTQPPICSLSETLMRVRSCLWPVREIGGEIGVGLE